MTNIYEANDNAPDSVINTFHILPHLELKQCYMSTIVIHTLQMRNMIVREVKGLAQGDRLV